MSSFCQIQLWLLATSLDGKAIAHSFWLGFKTAIKWGALILFLILSGPFFWQANISDLGHFRPFYAKSTFVEKTEARLVPVSEQLYSAAVYTKCGPSVKQVLTKRLKRTGPTNFRQTATKKLRLNPNENKFLLKII